MVRKKIELREERDFGQKFNAVFTFVQSNFKPFIKVIALTVGPLALIGGFFFGLFFSKMFAFVGVPSGAGTPDYAKWIGEIMISYFFLMLAALWMMISVYAFMAEYDRGNENITIEAVWKRGKSKIWPTIGFVFLTILVMAIFAVVNFTFPGSGPLSIIFKMVLFYAVIFYMAVTFSLVIPIMIIEDEGLFESIGRSFTLIRGKWWSTCGIMIVMGIIANFATMIFAIPFYAVFIVSMIMQVSAGEVLTTIGSCFLFLGSILMMTLPTLAIGFQYFNLVERKEGTGLLKKIDQLGKPVNTTNEGEY